MDAVKYYHPVPRGLEIKIREKLQDIQRRRHDAGGRVPDLASDD
jgi:predicted thioesterase